LCLHSEPVSYFCLWGEQPLWLVLLVESLFEGFVRLFTVVVEFKCWYSWLTFLFAPFLRFFTVCICCNKRWLIPKLNLELLDFLLFVFSCPLIVH
jgi:hypothetical protein